MIHKDKMHYPVLLLDAERAKKNIEMMAAKAKSCEVQFRPHFKTHQSHEIGEWFREVGVSGITVSSLMMAEYFSLNNWKDITIAFPVNILEIERLNSLSSEIDLNVLAVDEATLRVLDSGLNTSIGIYIELDPGYGRSGIPILEFEALATIKEAITSSQHLKFKGFYIHSGHSYKCRSIDAVRELVTPIIENLDKLKTRFDDPTCFGDTPSCSTLDDFGKIDQLSPGNFVFYDWTQKNIGSCTEDEIAIAMYCPVIAKYPERNELLIHGGAVHFSKDYLLDENDESYFGVVAESKPIGWGNVLNGNILKSISQEHGIIKCTPAFFDSVSVGDVLPILPIHSCLTANLMGSYTTLDGQQIDHMMAKSFSSGLQK